MTSCAASLTASSLSPSSGSGAGAGTDARAADSGAATRWAAHLPSSPASTAHWIGNTYLDDSGRDSPASLNSTGDM